LLREKINSCLITVECFVDIGFPGPNAADGDGVNGVDVQRKTLAEWQIHAHTNASLLALKEE